MDMSSANNFEPVPSCSYLPNGQTPKPKFRVLSLFDGIATGLVVLEKMGFEVEVYYASEIDRHALLVSKSYFGNRIKHLGSIKDIDSKKLDELGEINLLIGGSPCNDLSLVNRRGRGLFDTAGTGPLFFDFYRIWNILRQRSTQFYWLFENVHHMEKVYRSVISNYLESDYFVLDSFNISPQNRKRLFWSNFPEMKELEIKLEKTGIVGPELDQFLNKNLGRKANVRKCNTLTTKSSCLQDGKSRDPVQVDGKNSNLLITEIEGIFGFPIHYTDVWNMSSSQRQKLIGKAWSVPIIESIFEPMVKIFQLKENRQQ